MAQISLSICTVLDQIFLLVDLRDFFSDLRSGDEKNDQLTGSFSVCVFLRVTLLKVIVLSRFLGK